jgi:uncharacterized phage protein (TIGR02218 family)
MTFDASERSNYDGAPSTLYEFSVGTTYWRYVAAQNDIVLGGNTYTALAIANEGYSASGNPETDDLQVRISARALVTDLFLGTPPSTQVLLRIRTVHKGDTDAPVVWSGSVKSGRQVSLAEFVFTCNSLLSTLSRNGLRLSWERSCPHALYDHSCRVDPTAFDTLVQITQLTGSSVTATGIASLGDGYLSGGFLSFVGSHGATERRPIEGHVGNTVYVMATTDGLAVGSWITLYPGCNRTTVVCDLKFNNLANYGGFPHLPNKSPFDGDPVF